MSLVGKHVPIHDAAAYGTLDTSDKRLHLVRSILDSSARSHRPEQKAIAEQLLFNALQMAVDAGFTPDKTSAFGGILLETFDSSMTEFLPLESSFALFKELLTKHCVQRPPWSVGVFSVEDAKRITQYCTDTFFKHYMLYKYAFTTRKTLTFQSRHSYTAIPPIFPPLSEARSSQQVAADLAAAEAAVQRAPELSETADALQQEGLSQEAKALIAQRVNAEVAAIRAQLEEAFKQKEEEMRAKIEGLQRATAH